jgi:hypothetical protein
MSKDNTKINFDDFKLENIIDPTYEPSGLIDAPVEPADLTEPAAAVPNPPPVKEAVKEKVKVEPEPELEPDEDDDDAPESIPPDTTVDSPDELDFKPFYNLFHEKLGWEVPEDEMPENSIEGLIGYMNDLVEKNSKPQYSDETVAKFDEYVKNGGDPAKFLNIMYGSKDYAGVDLTTDADKKQVIKEYLSKVNPDKSADWIDKKINRFEDAGVLDDEAADALEELKSYQSREKENIVAKQQAEREAQEQLYTTQLRELETTILNKKEIAGIPVSQKEAKEFFEFLTKPEKDGTTAYEKTLSQDKEAAFKMAFLAYKKFDVNNLKSAVKSDVVKDLKKSLSKFTSSATELQSRTGLPTQKPNNVDYKAFDIGT